MTGNKYSIWSNIRYDVEDISLTDLRHAYEENVRYVLDYVEDLLPELHGKTVISADHGELLGERIWLIPVRGFEHEKTLFVGDLVRVPWLVVETGERKSIAAEPPMRGTDYKDERVIDRLEALGYR